jgi:hypothetical protein
MLIDGRDQKMDQKRLPPFWFAYEFASSFCDHHLPGKGAKAAKCLPF